MSSVFITGANRGIGLELARQYAQRGFHVFAAARTPEKADALRNINGQVTIVPLDVTDSQAIHAAAEQVQGETDALEILINNAGVMKRNGGLAQVTLDDSLHIMHVNAIAPVLVSRAFLPLLRRGNRPRLANITSQLGSLSRKTSGGLYDYCASKAALNMYTRALAADFRAEGIITVMIHPGWVQTDMGGASAALTAVESAEGVASVIDQLQPEQNGSFLRWDGTVHPW